MRPVILDKELGDAVGRELGPFLGLQERASVVAKAPGLDEDHIGKFQS